jgi:hypothetical protein
MDAFQRTLFPGSGDSVDYDACSVYTVEISADSISGARSHCSMSVTRHGQHPSATTRRGLGLLR